MKAREMMGIVLVFLIASLPFASADIVENVAVPSVAPPHVAANASDTALVAGGGAAPSSDSPSIFASLETGVDARITNPEEETGESIQVQVDSYEPRTLVSSLIEDNDVPVFAFLKASTLGSVLGLDLNGEPLYASPEIVQVNLRALDAMTNDFVRGVSPTYERPKKLTLDNLGHLKILLKQIPKEADVPNMINLSYSAEIYFSGVERLFNLIKTDLILPEDANEDVWRTKALTDYSFFAKRGFIRASDIGEDTATFTVYSGEDLLPPYTGTPRPIDIFSLKRGETSPFIRMRAARGLPQNTFRVKLNDITDISTKRARLMVTLGAKTEEVTVTEGNPLYPGSQWTVTKIETIKEGSEKNDPVREEVTIKSSTESRKVVRRYYPSGSDKVEDDPCVSLPVLDESRSKPLDDPASSSGTGETSSGTTGTGTLGSSTTGTSGSSSLGGTSSSTNGGATSGSGGPTGSSSSGASGGISSGGSGAAAPGDFEKGAQLDLYAVTLHDVLDNLLDLKNNEKYTSSTVDSVPGSDYLEVKTIDDKDAESFGFAFHKDYPGIIDYFELSRTGQIERVGKYAIYKITLLDVLDPVKDHGTAGLRMRVEVYEKISKPKLEGSVEFGVESSSPILGTITPKVDVTITSLSGIDKKVADMKQTRNDIVMCAAIDEYKKAIDNYPGITDENSVPLSALASFRIAQLYEYLGYPKFASKYYADSLAAGKGEHVIVASAKVNELEEEVNKNAKFVHADIVDNGNEARVTLRSIPSDTDKPTATIRMQNEAVKILGVGDKLFREDLVDEKLGSVYTYNWRIKSISSSKVIIQKFVIKGSASAADTKTLDLREDELIDGRSVFVQDIDSKKYVKISIVPGTGRPLISKSNFSLHIPIEKRAIPLAPDKIPNKINKTQETIRKLDKVITKLDKIVTTWKKVCLVTFLALTVKNSFLTGASRNIARNTVMRGVDGKGGWYNYCLKNSGKGKAYDSFDACVSRNLGNINTELDAAQNAVEKVNSEMKDYKNTGWYRDITENYTDVNKYGKYMADNFFSAEELRDYRYWQLMKNSDAYRKLDGSADGDIAKYNLKKEVDDKLSLYDFSNKAEAYNIAIDNLTKNYKNFDTLPEEEKRVVFNDVFNYNYEAVKATKDVKSDTYVLLSLLKPNVVASLRSKDDGFASYTPDGEKTLHPATVSDYKSALEKYKEEHEETLSKSESDAIDKETKRIDELFAKSPANVLDSEKGTVYKDDKGDLYVAAIATGISTGALSTTYAAGAVIEVYPDGSPYCIPVGRGNFVKVVDRHPDGSPKAIQEWNVGSDGKLCTVDDVLLKHESMLSRPEYASEYNGYASKVNSFGRHKPGEVVNVGGTLGFGGTSMAVSGQSAKASASLNAPTCYDVMDPSDCQLLFGVCDPVMCPPSRFNLGGAWHVDDVVQTGLIGSLVLGLNNFGPNEPIPICLTGVLAGLRNIKSILEGYVQCLNTAQIAGRSVGICDQIRSVYVCELLWNEVMSVFKIKGGLATVLSKFTSGESSGGGEYLTFQASLDNVGNSFNFFTKQYATNAFASYNSRSLDEFGGVVCKAAIFGKLPDFGGFIDEVSVPEDPPQYTGFVNELPFSETLGQSRYQVYYHIYAGKSAAVDYRVYLKNAAGDRYGVTDKCDRTSATTLSAGTFADQTIDCVASRGFEQMCISVNGKEECGFGKVTTEFALDYLGDLLVQDEVGRKINSEKECVPDLSQTSPSLGSLTLPGSSGLLSTGIQRVCSVKNPGSGSNPGNWKVVGSCGKNEMGISLGNCWIDVATISVNDLERRESINARLDEQTLRNEKARLGITDLLGTKEATAKLKEIDVRDKKDCKDFIVAASDYKSLADKSLNPGAAGEAQLHAGEMLEALAKTEGCVTKDEFREYKILLTKFESDADVLLKNFDLEASAILAKEPFKFGNDLDVKIGEYSKKLLGVYDGYHEELLKLNEKLGPSEFYVQLFGERKTYYLGKLEKTNPSEITTVSAAKDFSAEVKACNSCGEKTTTGFCFDDDCRGLGDCFYVEKNAYDNDCYSCSELISCNQLEDQALCENTKCMAKADSGKGISCAWNPGLSKCVSIPDNKYSSDIKDCQKCGGGAGNLCDLDECMSNGNCYYIDNTGPSDDCFSCLELTSCGQLGNEEQCEDTKCTSAASSGKGMSCNWDTENEKCLSGGVASVGIKGAFGFEEESTDTLAEELRDAGCPVPSDIDSSLEKLNLERKKLTYLDKSYVDIINAELKDTAFTKAIVAGIIRKESNFKYDAPGSTDDLGLGQFTGGTAPGVSVPCGNGRCDTNCESGKCYICSPDGCDDYDNRKDPDAAILGVYALLQQKESGIKRLCSKEYNALDDSIKLRVLISSYNLGAGLACPALKRAGTVKTYDDYVENIGPEKSRTAHNCYSRTILYYAANFADVFSSSKPDVAGTETGSANRFTFVVLSDSNGGGRSVKQSSLTGKAVASVINLKPSLVIDNGDMIAGDGTVGSSTDDILLIKDMWDEFFNMVVNPIVDAGIKFFPVAGNHDASFTTELARRYKERWNAYDPGWDSGFNLIGGNYPLFYSFDYQNNHFVVLYGAKPNLDSLSGQMGWLEADLKAAKGKYDHIFVFSHIQLKQLCKESFCSGDLQPNSKLVTLFNDNGVTIFFNGHQQVYYKGNYKGVNVVSTGSLAGPYTLIGASSKQPSSFVVVDVDGGDVGIKDLTAPAFTTEYKASLPVVDGYTAFREVVARA